MRTVDDFDTLSDIALADPPVAGKEPIPGYRLISPLGRGGTGEVWRCEAPGGMPKAVKFVFGDAHGLTSDDHPHERELAVARRVAAVRTPFLIGLDRVEPVGPNLVLVMEEADGSLDDRFRECVAAGLPGVPRAELLRHMADAAEALDALAAAGLQHLDVKPANLFTVGGLVKVGDYGLVSPVAGGPTATGFTPRYAAPERAAGQIDRRTDQYSLALVYHELLTGTFPFPDARGRGILVAHALTAPDLSALSPADREVVGRALAKSPEERFDSCSEFVRALTESRAAERLLETVPATPLDLRGVIPVTALGMAEWATEFNPPSAEAFARTLLGAGGGKAVPEPAPVVSERRPDGTLSYRFRTLLPPSEVGASLGKVGAAAGAKWGGRLIESGPNRIVLRIPTDAEKSRGGEQFTGLEIDLRPGPRGSADDEVWIAARDAGETKDVARLSLLFDDVCGELQALLDRRQSPRVPYTGATAVYPLSDAGEPLAPLAGRGIDISSTGVRLRTHRPFAGKQAYVAFPEVGPLAGWAVLVEMVRATSLAGEGVVAGRIRTDLDLSSSA